LAPGEPGAEIVTVPMYPRGGGRNGSDSPDAGGPTAKATITRVASPTGIA